MKKLTLSAIGGLVLMAAVRLGGPARAKEPSVAITAGEVERSK